MARSRILDPYEQVVHDRIHDGEVRDEDGDEGLAAGPFAGELGPVGTVEEDEGAAEDAGNSGD